MAFNLPTGEPSSSPVAAGLVLSGGRPSIPAELLTRILKHQYVELSELLPEKIQEACLYSNSKRKKSPPITEFTKWVLAFSTYGQELASQDPSLAPKRLVFVGSMARPAQDLPGVRGQLMREQLGAKQSPTQVFPGKSLTRSCGPSRLFRAELQVLRQQLTRGNAPSPKMPALNGTRELAHSNHASTIMFVQPASPQAQSWSLSLWGSQEQEDSSLTQFNL